ncbi:hypothetical protein Tco_1308340 [Tanacetum coccineum]
MDTLDLRKNSKVNSESVESDSSVCVGVVIRWVVHGVVDVYIGASPFAEGCGKDYGVDDQAVKVVELTL